MDFPLHGNLVKQLGERINKRNPLKVYSRFPNSFPTGNPHGKISLLETNRRFPTDFPWVSACWKPKDIGSVPGFSSTYDRCMWLTYTSYSAGLLDKSLVQWEEDHKFYSHPWHFWSRTLSGLSFFIALCKLHFLSVVVWTWPKREKIIHIPLKMHVYWTNTVHCCDRQSSLGSTPSLPIVGQNCWAPTNFQFFLLELDFPA